MFWNLVNFSYGIYLYIFFLSCIWNMHLLISHILQTLLGKIRRMFHYLQIWTFNDCDHVLHSVERKTYNILFFRRKVLYSDSEDCIPSLQIFHTNASFRCFAFQKVSLRSKIHITIKLVFSFRIKTNIKMHSINFRWNLNCIRTMRSTSNLVADSLTPLVYDDCLLCTYCFHRVIMDWFHWTSK